MHEMFQTILGLEACRRLNPAYCGYVTLHTSPKTTRPNSIRAICWRQSPDWLMDRRAVTVPSSSLAGGVRRWSINGQPKVKSRTRWRSEGLCQVVSALTHNL